MPHTRIDDQRFRRILFRNITLPLAAGIVSAAVFVAVFAYLLHALTMVEHSERVIGNAQELRKLTVDMETGMRGYLLTGEESFLAPYKLAKPKIETAVNTLNELVKDNPTQIDRLRNIRTQQQQWERAAEDMIRLRTTGGDYLSVVRAQRGKVEFDELRSLFQTFIGTEERLRMDRADDAKTVTYMTVVGFLTISLIISGLLAWFGRSELMKLSEAYNSALKEQGVHAERVQRQAWMRSGQSQLAEQGIGQMTLPALSTALLHFLARYLNVVVGAMYVREPDGLLKRVAAFGFSSEDEERGRLLAPDEGIVGQAAQMRRLIHLENLPKDYLKLSSALGSATPTQVLVLPVASDGRVNGVVELGFLHPVGERETEFLNLVADNIGTAIDATLARQRMQELLVESQQLNEELQVQQEELRTANEELEEQSRVLEESQASLENQKAELEQTNEQLAEQAVVLDQKNTALNDAQTLLEERARDLERASQYKSQFLANMSHELRTPLNSSLILAKLLADNAQGNLNDEQVRFAQTIYSAGNDLLNLINDILDISKVEAGKLELNPEELRLQQVMEGLSRTFDPLARQKGLDFMLVMEPGLPDTIYTDCQRLEQILKNLLSNALKFTDKGAVALRVQPDPNGQVRFAVQDTGIGIRADQHDAIFGAFQQADGGTSRKYGGTGLGLSISRDLATLLGGTITLESAVGQGSTFTLTLPVQWSAPPHKVDSALSPAPAPATAAVPPTPAPLPRFTPAPAPASDSAPSPAPVTRAFDDDRDKAPPPERTVLVIEDEPAFARILYDLAHEMDYRCLVAFAADEGLQMAEQYQPSAILLDVRLPDRSGLSVLQLLKDNPATRHIPVHVVSASDAGEAALHMGAIGFALKPTTREELMEVFARLEQKFTQKIKRILLVEDDARQRDSVVQLISDEDIEIEAVASGEEALALLRTTIFDCMIIDLKLPDMQGNELLQRMSHEEIASFPPVIVYTGRNLTRAEEADLHKYSRSIIIKGARSPERLLDEVTLFLHKVESELSSERQSMLKTVRSRDRVFEGRRILLVDDDVRNIFALTSALEQKGAIVEIGRNGFEALEKLDAVADIDLVLMDVMMPGMDGLEATRRIRADGRFNRLPIIAITAKAMKDDQEQCLAAGANDYLAKPIDLSRLYSLLRVWMPALDRI
ncbi:signal transduction histidine kinase [Pseudoduganella flava]|uniref:Virulence sensor protein BvgS n=1 Tax=Pseudoduganella flava TaxID=871742 RepID=A0A562PCG4_9BURK|nr:response regulator [Pseudoduganella flava]QGZ40159.1 response regulator [Pseudoduganella flava]TWI42111.1 signal transduction histidine kinase [Pseudoduganella flava]